MAKNYKNEDEWDCYPLIWMHFNCWKKVPVTGELSLVEQVDLEYNIDYFMLLYVSFKTGKFKYMNDDKKLDEYVKELAKMECEVYELDDSLELIFDYPEEFKTRTPLIPEEIAYYMGDNSEGFSDEEYQDVADVDEIVKKVEFDIFNKLKKRPDYDFETEAEYKLYRVILRDYAQLEEQ